MMRIVLFLLCLTFSIQAIELHDAPIKYEIGSYYSGISLWKTENAHSYGVGAHYQDNVYPHLKYGFSNMFQLEVGNQLNVTTSDYMFSHIFLDTGLFVKTYLNPLMIEVRYLQDMSHVVASYKNKAGISYLHEQDETINIGSISGFINVPVYLFDIKGRVTKRVSNTDIDGVQLDLNTVSILLVLTRIFLYPKKT